MKTVLFLTMVVMNNCLNPSHKLFSRTAKSKRRGMALIKFGGGVADARGSVGGTVFSRNRFGAYTRNRTIPVNPGTSPQTKIRSIMSVCRNAWFSTLTAAQRTAWDTYAAGVAMTNRIGEVIHLTGWNHFVRSASSLLYADESIVAAGPTDLSLPEQDETIAVTPSEATGLLSIAYDDTQTWCDEDGAHMLIFVSRGKNPTVNFFKGPYRYAGKISGDSVAPPVSPQTVTSPFALTEGQRVFVQCRIVRADGRISEPFRSFAAVGA